MIASQAAIRETRQSLQKALWDPSEDPVSMQLVGCEPLAMGEAARLAEDKGAAIVDINMGCPVRQGRQWRCRIGADGQAEARRRADRSERSGP